MASRPLGEDRGNSKFSLRVLQKNDRDDLLKMSKLTETTTEHCQINKHFFPMGTVQEPEYRGCDEEIN